MKFIKMQSLGNDFIIIEDQDKLKNIVQICDRHFGIGCDQLMITTLTKTGIDLQIFNQDGSVANMCGNGIRCVSGRYFDLNPQKNEILINILPKNQKFLAQKTDNNLIKVEFLDPKIDSNIVDIGNLHKIINVGISDKLDVFNFIFSKIENKIPHQDYNINYISIQNNVLYIITIERGVGQTLACGSGAVASGIFAIKNSLILPSKIQIISHGSIIDQSELYVEYDMITNKVFLIGGYKYVFDGKIII